MVAPQDNFVARCLRGEAFAHDIESEVERWHTSTASLDLATFLGLSDDEYAIWVEKPAMLEVILMARKQDMTLPESLGFIRNEFRAAARVGSESEAEALYEWLEHTGRI